MFCGFSNSCLQYPSTHNAIFCVIYTAMAPIMIMDSLPAHILEVVKRSESVFVVNLEEVKTRIKLWKEELPLVRPFYAVKANLDSMICQLLLQEGCGFDCASKVEIERCLELGASAADIIFANPVKFCSHLQYAQNVEVSRVTADSVDELKKIAQYHKTASVLLRIAVDDTGAVCRFSSKFGAFPSEWHFFFEAAEKYGINLSGVSFHVGSGCSGPMAFYDAIASARDAFDLARSHGFEMKVLDLGGGFPGDENSPFTFTEIATAVRTGLSEFFGDSVGLEILAEPGRFFVESSHHYIVTVTSGRNVLEEHLKDSKEIERTDIDTHMPTTGYEETTNVPEKAVFISDGVYGAFNNVVFDHAKLNACGFAGAVTQDQPFVRTKVFGPTCDSIDVVSPCMMLPSLSPGDRIVFSNMGAYTRSAGGNFNGFGHYSVVYTGNEL